MNSTIDIRRLHDIQLRLLKEFDSVCRNHGITYFLAYGTLLGAIRHDGFIPWDDDVDVIVPYSDFMKLETIGEKEFSYPYFYQNSKTDSEFKAVFSKLRNSSTTLIDSHLSDFDINHGVCIDIYPMINVPDDSLVRKRYLNYIKLYYLAHINSPAKNHGKKMYFATFLFTKLMPKWIVRHIEVQSIRKATKLMPKASCQVTIITGSIKDLYDLMDSCWFDSFEEHCFEDKSFYVPSEFNKILTTMYGDYMTLPAEDDRGIKLDNFIKFDPDKSYKEYKGIYFCNKDSKSN